MELTKSDIEEINKLCPDSEQGIYTEPYGIPVHIKEPVIYMRYEVGGVGGGSCWNDSNSEPYTKDERPSFKVLDLTLKRLCPNLTFLQFREVEELIHTNEESDYEYYGNSTDYEIKYVIISEIINLLNTFEK